MTDNERNVFERALMHYGPELQTTVLVEEMAELQKEICKYWRGRPNYDHIAEEMADLSIMLDQMKLLFQNGGAVQGWRLEKVRRLADRIAAEESGA
ncbi:MAG: hypothetical protein IJI06_09735 [Oscillospiraceae bacterium]|nr:hypothetical protein [Oscillospiraceae bacterium]